MSFKHILWLTALSLTLQANAVSPSLRRLQDESSKLAEMNKVLISALKEISAEEFVGQKFDRCATRTMCVANCVADDESKRFECLKDVCPKEMCVEEESVAQMFDRCATRTKCVADCVADDESKRLECLKDVCPKELCVEEQEVAQFGGPPDCHTFDSSCVGCRGEEQTCCTDINCGHTQTCRLSMSFDWVCTPPAAAATVAQEKRVGAYGSCRESNNGGPPEGAHCDSRWEHVVWWNVMHEYCRSDKPGRGCKYGYLRSGLYDYCCYKLHFDLDMCRCF